MQVAEVQDLCLPSPLIKPRNYDRELYEKLCNQDYDPMFARVVAGRKIHPTLVVEQALQPGLNLLSSPAALADGGRAAQRIAKAIAQKEIIALETDHDCDGQTSHAVLYSALINYFGHPETHLQSFIGHRLEEGYGLSVKLLERILATEPRPNLVITADNGSSDQAQIAILEQHGIDVIVTDHHALPVEGPPKSAYAVVNPTRLDCEYPDKAIAGCFVAWLMMVLVRQSLIAKDYPLRDKSDLRGLLDFVALGTVADCVNLGESVNNRAVVRYGLQLMAQWVRPCWRAMRSSIGESITAETLGFQVAPLLNSDGRLSDAFGAVNFLLTQDDETAASMLGELMGQNQARKKIQRQLTSEGIVAADKLVKENYVSLCVAFEEGHPGVHGISASRIKDTFGRPTILFSPKWGSPEILTGSARSIDALHIREALQAVAEREPGVIIGFGGHKGAAGLSIAKSDFTTFRTAFEQVVKSMVPNSEIGPVLWTDGPLLLDKLTVPWLQQFFDCLAPFGRLFEAPVFELQPCKCLSVTPMGDGTHARLKLLGPDGRQTLDAVWFQCRMSDEVPMPLQQGQKVHVALRAAVDCYRERYQLKYFIEGIKVL